MGRRDWRNWRFWSLCQKMARGKGKGKEGKGLGYGGHKPSLLDGGDESTEVSATELRP